MDEQKPPSEDKDAPGERMAECCVCVWVGEGPGAVPPNPMGRGCPSLRVLMAAFPTADAAASSEEMGSAEGDPLKPPEGATAGPELESTDTKGAGGASRWGWEVWGAT